jgi:hypothetical protein
VIGDDVVATAAAQRTVPGAVHNRDANRAGAGARHGVDVVRAERAVAHNHIMRRDAQCSSLRIRPADNDLARSALTRDC